MNYLLKMWTLALFLLFAFNVTAQLNPKKLLEKKVQQKTNEIINQKQEPAPKPQADNQKKPEVTNDNSQADKQGNPSKPADGQACLEMYSKYDFVPGEKVIFFDDFTQDNVGDFPAAWNTNGSGELVTTNLYPGKWLKFVSRDAIWSDQLLNLPENYTIEFDVIPIKGTEGGMAGYGFRLMQSINTKAFDAGAVPGKAGLYFGCEYFGRPFYRTYINGQEGVGLGLSGTNEEKSYYVKENQLYHIAVWIQKSRVRVYQNEVKLFDLPKAFPVSSVKMDRIRFEDGAAMVGNIRIAVGVPDMRNKLLTEGKIVSYGIYFDVNKDVVKPESYGSLKEIAGILTENPSVRIRIVGHTDSDGADDANLDLSKRRSASVKNELVTAFRIDASRIETDGKGETQPVAANDSPSNKALNRRVEFIKL
ncbi:MAG TPA: OmpA family protein [Hanamia sp.]|nr:OmpA family protein [Hanamia sp.]